VGVVRSPLHSRDIAPRQADEGAPPARIEVEGPGVPALEGLAAGDRILVLTWLHLADRTVVRTRPRDDPARVTVGVFATRSPDRPNPIGLHPCTVLDVNPTGIEVDALEAVDGTPVLDIKPVLGRREGR
jgi:tRNA-Thr(GGU) m(6)t(6)A37 methyltransferase TsaA